MAEMIWLNGEVLPLDEARIGVEDRGFQFADGVYEVIRLYNGRPFTLAEHLERLERSCAGIAMQAPMPRAELARHITDFVGKSPVRDGMVYLQVTRGCYARNHVWTAGAKPTVLFFTRALPPIAQAGQGEGAVLLSVADERWKKCWVKSIALLANVLAKNTAVAAGADEGVFVDDGMVTECTASNSFVVAGGKVLTHPVGPKVLPGITRLVLLGLARELDIAAIERPVSEAEALAADEVFITSTTREISWVRKWNEKVIGSGKCGPVTLRLHRALQERVRQATS
jgi:D-alanine transaminase